MRRYAILPLISASLAFLLSSLASTPIVHAGEGGAPGVAIGPPGERYPDGTAISIMLSSPALKSNVADKEALRDLYFAMLSGTASRSSYQSAKRQFNSKYHIVSRSTPMIASFNMNNAVYLSQVAEQYCPSTGTYCYCGPATGYSMLNQLGYPTSHDREALSQNILATNKYMETNYWGNTPWTGLSNDHPVPESLNYWMTGSYSGFYIPAGLPNAAPDLYHFKLDMTSDIDAGYSLAPDIHEKAYDNNHLPGHPNSQEIWHWLPIYGYSSYADTTVYADPATSAWPTVQAYNSVTSSQMDSLIQDRGLVW